MQLSGNTILITGGTSGIGRALAEAFYQCGNVVIIAGRRQKLLDEITASHPGMHGLALDVEDPDAMDAFASHVKELFPKLNVLINNAGISKAEDLTKDVIDVNVSRSIIQTNIVSVLHLTATLLPTLKRKPSSTVIATTSGLAFVPRNNYPTYCASKAFLHSWLQSLRVQLRETSVDVLELTPPYVQTELAGALQATDPNAMPLADFIAEVMQILDRGDTSNGEILVERVKALRWADRHNNYDQMFSALNG
ncbi:SDR family oxidoreductase [Janthinobacterium sp.]|uniref:SDR family oxidoreductase n=1 Tax=Janthinobacterium sp. TaxID=1871054 RepID=UPI00293D4191|nr:SDR family oxidoreductase [Janthinobacterium sp.]